ncbi:MAG: hypothetical protein NTU61_00415, partial [Candidatus Altiarchaeota archaeon]|nr:hypothetical protein [Candidatus Altiarchaeota archaeon]
MRDSVVLSGLLILIVLSSGCVCCCGDLNGILGGDGSTGGNGDGGVVCESPYIQVGAECCLDGNANGICDSDEESTDTTLGGVTDTTIQGTTVTTLASSTTLATLQTTSTISATATTFKSTYACVQNAGYDPNKVIYVYSNHCGNEFTSTAMTAESRTGVGFQMINIGVLDQNKIKVLECFYGGYYQGNIEFSYCPRLLCPKTGKITN